MSETGGSFKIELRGKAWGIESSYFSIAPPTAPVSEKPSEGSAPPKDLSVCYVSDKLIGYYNQLLLELKKAELAGDKEKARVTTERISTLAQETPKGWELCEEAPIDRCQDVELWSSKIAYYKKLSALSDPDLKKETSRSREEIEKTLTELSVGLQKVREQCRAQKEYTVTSAKPLPPSVVEPVKPVAVESGQEISSYYRAYLEKVTNIVSVEDQIKELKTLRGEIDKLVRDLIEGKREIRVSEISGLVTEVQVSRGQIKAGDVVVKTMEKKIIVDVGEEEISIEPTKKGGLIKDKGLEVKVEEVSIKDEILRVGNSEVKVVVSDIVANLEISPTSIELKEENEKAIYSIGVREARKLLGFIPVTITIRIIVNATNGNFLEERLPWYSFLTRK
ncbi:MAG TPA: hypothetical protein ENH86_01945 [Candidatus Jorgensenbacteria bacterium]|nr:hypothetical protein [Candidatus Jorgensenbacteria bacterium]